MALALRRAGLADEAAARKAELFAEAAAAISRAPMPRHDEILALYVPGRIEILGKHTDYAGGQSMVAAAEQAICVVAQPRDDGRIRVTDAANGQTVAFPMDASLELPTGDWSRYPMTVARRLARNFPSARRGAEIGLASDLPPAAGMSSSSALVVAVALALVEINRPPTPADLPRLWDDPLALAGYLACVENGRSYASLAGHEGVGTLGGSEDHTAILDSRSGRIGHYAYGPLRRVADYPLPDDLAFAIATSGVVAEKTGAARSLYNRASSLAAELVALWSRATGEDRPHLGAILEMPEAAERFRAIVDGLGRPPDEAEALRARLEHFIEENQRILPAAADALRQGRWDEFGRWVDASQQAAEALLGNQMPETIHLARTARRLGAAAASAFGAGFGGSVWALIEKQRAGAFLAAWAADYHAAFPRRAVAGRFFVTQAGPAAFRLR